MCFLDAIIAHTRTHNICIYVQTCYSLYSSNLQGTRREEAEMRTSCESCESVAGKESSCKKNRNWEINVHATRTLPYHSSNVCAGWRRKVCLVAKWREEKKTYRRLTRLRVDSAQALVSFLFAILGVLQKRSTRVFVNDVKKKNPLLYIYIY